MKVSDYIKLDAISLAEMVRNKEVKAEDLVELSFKRLEEVNGDLNAVASTRKEAALREAKAVDLTKPFAGVPFYLKGISQSLAGQPLAGGAKLFKDLVSEETSLLTQMFRETGLLCLGHSTVPEFALKNITESELFGPTRNAWNSDYTPGGSSGGAAALVASGVVPIAGASDGGGSIRIPASFSGLFGLKPTRGRTAVGPGVGRQWQGAAIDFLLSRSVRDSARALDELQIVQESAAFQTPLFDGSYEAEIKESLPKKMKIAYTTESPVGTPVTKEAKEAVEQVISWFKEAGHEVVSASPEIDGKKLMKNYYLMNSGEISAVISNIEQGINRPVTADDLEIETWLLNVAGRSVSAAEFSLSLASWDQAAEVMSEFHANYDLYITPAAASTAPKVGELTHSIEAQGDLREKISKANPEEQQALIYEMFLPSLTYTPFTQLANLTGQPAVSVPTYLAENGLPIGVQIMASKGEDALLLQVAQHLEASDLWIATKPLLT